MPPDTVAVNVTWLPTVGFALTVKLTIRVVPETLTVWVAVVVAEFASVTVRVTVSPPLAEYV